MSTMHTVTMHCTGRRRVSEELLQINELLPVGSICYIKVHVFKYNLVNVQKNKKVSF